MPRKTKCGDLYDPISYAASRKPTSQPARIRFDPLGSSFNYSSSGLHARAYVKKGGSEWANSQLSTPPGGVDWENDPNFSFTDPDVGESHYYHYDDEMEDEQFIYVIENCFDFDHEVSVRWTLGSIHTNWGSLGVQS